MNKKNRKDLIIISIVLTVFTALLVTNIVISCDYDRKAAEGNEAEAGETVQDTVNLRELSRNQDMGEIIDFDEKYSEMEGEYLDKISDMSDIKAVNMRDIIALADERVEAAREFKSGLEGMEDIPEALDDFYVSMLDFLSNDIYTWQEIKLFYSGNFDGDDADIWELHEANSDMYSEVVEKQQKVYSEYGLEDLL